MLYGVAADLVVLLHFGFIVFVVLGGFAALRWPGLVFVHLPAVLWSVVVEFTGWICPLTPLEQGLRSAAGEEGYQGSFIEHYLVPVLYPESLTPALQVGLGLFVILVNLLAYALLCRKRRTARTRGK